MCTILTDLTGEHRSLFRFDCSSGRTSHNCSHTATQFTRIVTQTPAVTYSQCSVLASIPAGQSSHRQLSHSAMLHPPPVVCSSRARARCVCFAGAPLQHLLLDGHSNSVFVNSALRSAQLSSQGSLHGFALAQETVIRLTKAHSGAGRW